MTLSCFSGVCAVGTVRPQAGDGHVRQRPSSPLPMRGVTGKRHRSAGRQPNKYLRLACKQTSLSGGGRKIRSKTAQIRILSDYHGGQYVRGVAILSRQLACPRRAEGPIFRGPGPSGAPDPFSLRSLSAFIYTVNSLLINKLWLVFKSCLGTWAKKWVARAMEPCAQRSRGRRRQIRAPARLYGAKNFAVGSRPGLRCLPSGRAANQSATPYGLPGYKSEWRRNMLGVMPGNDIPSSLSA